MTREESINLLVNISAYDVSRYAKDKHEAIEMAIQALEQQKVKEIQGIMEGGWTVTFEVPDTQKSDKYRKEAKRWKNKWLKSQKSGKWIDINGIYAECSNCNEEIYITGDFKFCPNCGARMESE